MQTTELRGRSLFRQNPILREGLLAAPIACFADTIAGAVMLCLVFAAVTAGTVLLSRLIPQRLPEPFRIVSYSLTAVLVYVPAAFAAEAVFPEPGAGVYLSLLACGLYLSADQERVFPREMQMRPLVRRLLCVLAGVCLLTLCSGILRELLGAEYPVFRTPAAGIIMLAVCCILIEKYSRKQEDAPCR